MTTNFKVGDRVEWTEPDRHPSFIVRYRGKVVIDVVKECGLLVVEVDERFCFHPEHPENGREIPYALNADRDRAIESVCVKLIEPEGAK